MLVEDAGCNTGSMGGTKVAEDEAETEELPEDEDRLETEELPETEERPETEELPETEKRSQTKGVHWMELTYDCVIVCSGCVRRSRR